MTNLAFDLTATNDGREEPRGLVLDMARVPRITIHAFCNGPEISGAVAAAAADRRMARARLELHPGGIAAAREAYQQSRTPNLLVLESTAPREALLLELDSLAELCDAATKVIVIGHVNDVTLYRALMDRGVHDYLVAPLDIATIIGAIARLYRGAGAEKLGKVCAFIGAKGGVGSSTVAHNVASVLVRETDSEVMIADMDVAFGTAGLNFNLEPGRGMAEIIDGAGQVDGMMLERLLTKCGDNLNLLAAPAALRGDCDLNEAAFDQMLEAAQDNMPFVVLDIPHVWTSWVRKTLLAADEVVITACPDLANLRNAKNLIEFLKQARPNDAPPRLILNQIGVPKRPEIKPRDFADALQLEPVASLRFEASAFGTAANEGRMIADTAGSSELSAGLAEVARIIGGQRKLDTPRRSGLAGLFNALKMK